MNEVTITRLKHINRDDVYSLLIESRQEGFRHINRLVDEYEAGTNTFDKEGEALFVAMDGHDIIGVCGLNTDAYGSIDAGRLRRLYIMKRYRRRGIGRKLTEAVASIAKNHFKALVLRTDNPAACSFYRGMGFVEVPDCDYMTHKLDF